MKPQTEIEKELKDSFKLFSRGSGKVNLRQLRLALTKLGEKMSENEAEELFDMMDENEDGVVDIDGKSKCFIFTVSKYTLAALFSFSLYITKTRLCNILQFFTVVKKR